MSVGTGRALKRKARHGEQASSCSYGLQRRERMRGAACPPTGRAHTPPARRFLGGPKGDASGAHARAHTRSHGAARPDPGLRFEGARRALTEEASGDSHLRLSPRLGVPPRNQPLPALPPHPRLAPALFGQPRPAQGLSANLQRRLWRNLRPRSVRGACGGQWGRPAPRGVCALRRPEVTVQPASPSPGARRGSSGHAVAGVSPVAPVHWDQDRGRGGLRGTCPPF